MEIEEAKGQVSGVKGIFLCRCLLVKLAVFVLGAVLLTSPALARIIGGFELPAKKLKSRPVMSATGPIHSATQSGPTFTEPVTGMEFVWVPGGCFLMGSNDGDRDEKPVHKVCVDGFWMGKYEVTQGQWKKIMGRNPSKFKKGDNYPIEEVSWNDCQEFIKKLNVKNSRKFRLPTEAEWEYVCRKGREKKKYFGGANINEIASCYADNSGLHTNPVGSKSANSLGVYDLSSNVWEWCSDWYGENYYAKSPEHNPRGPSSGFYRVVRGGRWDYYPRLVRVADRYRYNPGYHYQLLGVRLVSQ